MEWNIEFIVGLVSGIIISYIAYKTETSRYGSKFEKAKNHLQWIYKRMIIVHNENEKADYMQNLKEIIES